MRSYTFSWLKIGDHAKYIKEYEHAGFKVLKPYDEPFTRYHLGGFTIHPFEVPHDDTKCYGFLIKHEEIGRFLYMTDLEYCPYVFKKHSINHMLIEANYDSSYLTDEVSKRLHVLKGHSSIGVACGIIEANRTDKLQNVILCHLSQESADPMEFMEKAKKVALKANVDYARSGLELELIDGDICPFM